MNALLSRDDVNRMFATVCDRLGVHNPERVRDLALYELTDGTRTTTGLDGAAAYVNGAEFVLRLAHMLNVLGARTMYVITTARRHRARSNYPEIMAALREVVGMYRTFAREAGVRLRFYGDYQSGDAPETAGFAKALHGLEQETKDNPGLQLICLVDYAADWACSDPAWQALPPANVMVRHTKGTINEGTWLPGKLDGNSFVYAQNGSVSDAWSDMDLMHMVGVAVRSMLAAEGFYFTKEYQGDESAEIRRQRETELAFKHERLTAQPSKRLVMFSTVGPEVYEF
jgi:hypothetical protein